MCIYILLMFLDVKKNVTYLFKIQRHLQTF